MKTRQFGLGLLLAAACSASPAPEPTAPESEPATKEDVQLEALAALPVDVETPAMVSVLMAPDTEEQPPPPPSSTIDAEPPPPPPDSAAVREPPSDAHRQLDAIEADITANRLVPARTKLTGLLATLERGGSLDERMTATALLARLHDRSRNRRAAAAEYKKVLELWETDKGFATMQRPGDLRSLARIAHALTAVGEALFFDAERARERADAIVFPAPPRSSYVPPAKKLQDMNADEFQREMDRRKLESEHHARYISTSVKSWMDSKRAALEEAEKAYTKIVDLRPMPPPIWLVGGASRVGKMWSDFTDEFTRVPMPKWMAADPELSHTYRASLEEAVAPFRARARAAFATCKRSAEIYKVKNEHSEACDAWMAAHP